MLLSIYQVYFGGNKMKYYAVKKGHTVGVYNSWPECQSAINGFPGAEHKWFSTIEEAEAFISGFDIYLDKVKKDIENGYVVAFTDGSFEKNTKQYSYGVVIIDPELVEYELSGSSKNPTYADSANISGEVFGLINALDWAVSNNYRKIKVYHDYNGLSEWVTGRWQANSPISMLLVSIIQKKYLDVIEIEFEHVKGHSNNRFNNRADQLASEAISSRVRIPITGDNWYNVQHVKVSEFEALLQIMLEEEPAIHLVKSVETDRVVFKLALHKDKVTISSFLSGKQTLMVQGKLTLLFQVVTTYIQDLLSNGAMNFVFSSAYRTTIDSDYVSSIFDTQFGNLPHDYPESLKKLIKQSIINLKYFVKSEDYAQYAFPALRALEGHIKFILFKAGVVIISKDGFHCFNKENGNYVLTSKGTLNSAQIKYIEEMYTYYYDNRHALFHFGDLFGSVDSTRMIEEKEVADELISKCFELITRNV